MAISWELSTVNNTWLDSRGLDEETECSEGQIHSLREGNQSRIRSKKILEFRDLSIVSKDHDETPDEIHDDVAAVA